MPIGSDLLRKRGATLLMAYIRLSASRITIDDLAPPGARAAERLIRREGIQQTLKTGEQPNPPAQAAGHFLLVVERGSLDLFLPGASFPGPIGPVASVNHGSAFGEMPLLAMRTFGAIARAAMETEILILDAGVIGRLLLRSPKPALAMLSALAAALTQAEDLLLAQAGVVRPGLIQLLLRLAGDGVVIRGASLQQLADSLLVHRGTVYKVMRQLRAEGYLDWTRSRIIIREPDRLFQTRWELPPLNPSDKETNE